VKQAPLSTIIAGIVGLLLGLIAASLLAVPLSLLPGPLGSWLPFAAAVVLVWGGVAVLVARSQQLLQLFHRTPAAHQARSERTGAQLLLDTSAIIDGRIADVAKTGFISGEMVVPRFILEELQHIADSADQTRRLRGRRGFEVLERLKKDTAVPLRITEEVRDGVPADSMLVALAKERGAAILTTDFNLNRVAELQGVRVLNINQLAHAVKPVFQPGEEMTIHVVQEGREAGQGVGFLEDGTMLVVEGGRRFIGSQVPVEVTRVLQTAGGRIIFAHPKDRAA